MDRIIDIYEANSIVNEFYVLTKDQFITNGVKIEQKTYSDKQRGDYLNIKEHTDNDDFYCCEIHLKIVYKQKSIDVYFIIYSNHNFYSDNNIYIRNYIVSNSSNYKFDLHDYVVNRYGMFKEYKEDWTSYEANLSEYPNLKMATAFFFEKLKQLIETEDMQRILNTDYAPEIPIDWSRCGYK